MLDNHCLLPEEANYRKQGIFRKEEEICRLELDSHSESNTALCSYGEDSDTQRNNLLARRF